MNRDAIQTIDGPDTGTAHPPLPGSAAPAPAQSERADAQVRCFHCGEPCRTSDIARGGRIFCCHGCLLVHDLLLENGLGHFYDLNRSPGTRAPSAAAGRWAFLDDASVQEKLLDFNDGESSRVTFRIPAIHCVACVWLLENLFRLHPGIGRTEVNFPARTASISFAPRRIRLSDLVALLCSIGYEPSLTLEELEPKQPDSNHRRQWLQIGVAGFAFGNIMLFSLPAYLGLDVYSGPTFKTVFGGLSLLLALPVVLFSASDYWKSARLSVRQRRLTLDVPIALGLAAIYGQSVVEILSRSGNGYCDSLTGLVFLLLCGRVFQQSAQERLVFDRDYRSFFPLAVTRLARPASGSLGGEERVPLSRIQPGDHLLVRNGELIPADARLIAGPALIDYSFVTGESEPTPKQPGDYLYAGGQHVGAAIEIEIVRAVSQSYLTSLWTHEAFRKDRTDELDTLIDRYSRGFTPGVIGVALLAAVFWVAAGDPGRGLKAFTSVLIVACPCALALAAPCALGTARRCLARARVFLKNTQVLERLARVDTIVFDKTGTLTTADPGMPAFRGAALTPAEREAVSSLARHSVHPHALRITEWLSARSAAPIQGFVETPGCGIEGRVADHEILLGSDRWLAARHVSAVPDRPDTGLDGSGRVFSEPGSRVHLAVDGRYRGAFLLQRGLRPEAEQLIRELGARYDLALLSGDNDGERGRFEMLFGRGAALHFNQGPLDKLNFIRRLQQSGRIVMMVGDGLNDAGAFKQSDVGLALVERIGAFSPASDVILEAGQVPRLGRLLAVARRGTRIVRLSFGISAVYNVAGVGIAAAGLLSPLVCAVLMPLSSVTVVAFACGMTIRAARREIPADITGCLENARETSNTERPTSNIEWQKPDVVSGFDTHSAPLEPAAGGELNL